MLSVNTKKHRHSKGHLEPRARAINALHRAMTSLAHFTVGGDKMQMNSLPKKKTRGEPSITNKTV